MQENLWVFPLLLGSYLVGAIPFALVAGKLRGMDIRKHGSGNLGATNAIRVLGKPVGLTVFILDFLKGLAPAILVRMLPLSCSDKMHLTLAFAAGVAAVLGHIFPVYLRFKGGKGVAATAGAMLAVGWKAALIAYLVFFTVRKLTGYVSASSMALVLAFPLSLFAFHGAQVLDLYVGVVAGSGLLAVIIFFRHMSNWIRIMTGEEPKIKSRKSREAENHEAENHEAENYEAENYEAEDYEGS